MFFFLQLSGSKNLSETSTHSGICKPGQFCKCRTDTDDSHKHWKQCVYLHDSLLLSCNSPESELKLVILISFSFFLCLIPTHFFLAKSLCLALLFQSPPFARSYLDQHITASNHPGDSTFSSVWVDETTAAQSGECLAWGPQLVENSQQENSVFFWLAAVVRCQDCLS